MDTKFNAFLKDKKIDARRIVVASTKLERLRPEDRAVKLTERLARKSDEGKKKNPDRKKPRTGRPVTQRMLDAAATGKAIAGPAKTRLLRAVNAVLALKKQEPVTLDALFDAPKKGAPKAEAEAAS